MSEPLPIRSLRTPRTARAGGFTLTELLVVVAIIVLLIGTLFVALGAAAKRAQLAKTTFLMGSIASGLAKFEGDFGYLPPVLGPRDTTSAPGSRGFARDVVKFTQVAGANEIEQQQNWLSYTTLAEYLIGYGHRGEDGYGGIPGGPAGVGNKELPPFGIRGPGPDGCWGAVDARQPALSANPQFAGYFRARNPNRSPNPPAVNNNLWNTQAVEGRVYGPYIDTIDERLLGGLAGFDASGRPQIVTPDQGVANFDQLPKCLLDYWGEPIAYYRAPYGGDDPASDARKPGGDFFSLGDVYVLRPWEVDPNDRSVGAADLGGDDSSSAGLKSASFALLSKGADRAFDRSRRRDLGEFNKDNIVLTGK